MSDDLVAQLKGLQDEFRNASIDLQSAIDEILALHTQLEAVKGIAGNERKLSEAIIQQARDEALEAAARACERRRDETGRQEAYGVLDVESYTSACGGCAYDIRALKDRA